VLVSKKKEKKKEKEKDEQFEVRDHAQAQDAIPS
jgi:hypothetical protein